MVPRARSQPHHRPERHREEGGWKSCSPRIRTVPIWHRVPVTESGVPWGQGLLPMVPEPCRARGRLPLPMVSSLHSPPLPARLFPKFNPSPHTTNLSPPCDLLGVTVVSSGHGHEGRGGSQAAEQPQPHGVARGQGCPARGRPGATAGPCPLMSAGVRPRSIGASCHRWTPGGEGGTSVEPDGWGGVGSAIASGQETGQRPLRYPKGWVGWDGLEETSPRNWYLGAHPLPPTTSSSRRLGRRAAAGARGALSSPKNCSALALATGKIKSPTSEGS